jgi:hypothetical protein
MGQSRSIETSVLEARHKVFNQLCTTYRRSAQDPDFGLRAYDVMVELAIPLNLFAEALDGFVDVNGELIIRCLNARASDIFDSEKQQSITAAIDRAELVKFVSGETRRKF